MRQHSQLTALPEVQIIMSVDPLPRGMMTMRISMWWAIPRHCRLLCLQRMQRIPSEVPRIGPVPLEPRYISQG